MSPCTPSGDLRPAHLEYLRNSHLFPLTVSSSAFCRELILVINLYTPLICLHILILPALDIIYLPKQINRIIMGG